MAMLSLEAEQATAHLTVLGWKPVVIKWSNSTRYAVQNINTGQLAIVFKSRSQQVVVDFQDKPSFGKIEDIEWWKLTDLSILTLVAVIDNTLIGWGGCE